MSATMELCEFAAHLTLATGAPPHALLPHVRRLRRLATSHQRRCVVQCNGCRTCAGWGFLKDDGSPQWAQLGCDENEPGARPCPTCSLDTVEAAIETTCTELTTLRLEHLAKVQDVDGWGFALSPIYQHDPRGATVKLRLPSGAELVVPTSGRA